MNEGKKNSEKKPRPDYLEIYTYAHAWVLFERLAYKNVIKKQNRRVYLIACLRLSHRLLEELYLNIDEQQVVDP